MKRLSNNNLFAAGLALFAILFGSGNIVFPLVLGRDTGNMVWFAVIGLSITAIIVPLLGLVSTMLAGGHYKQLLNQLGTAPAHLITLICMLLIGPFGVIPRCVTIAHAAVAWYIPTVSLLLFSVVTAVVIFALTFRHSVIIDVIGRFLGPIKLTLLLSIIIFGLYKATVLPAIDITAGQSIYNGLIEGLWTLDLLGTVFFAGLILNNIKKYVPVTSTKELGIISLKVGLIGSGLLGIVYAGFCVVAAMNGPALANVNTAQILTALAALILGPKAGILANATVAISCLTTAVALTVLFSDWFQKDVCQNKINYLPALLFTIITTAIMSHLGFERIMQLIAPIVTAFYPALIVLAIVNIAHQLYGWKYIKLPVALTFVITLGWNYWGLVTKCFLAYSN